MEYKNKRLGFTLLELMVTIAIIGILAGVILTFLSSARKKAQESQIKQQLTQLRTQGNLYLAEQGNYGSVGTTCSRADGFFADARVTPLLVKMGNAVKYCANTSDLFAVAVKLPVSAGFWCVDFSNNSQRIKNITGPGDLVSAAYNCSATDLNP